MNDPEFNVIHHVLIRYTGKGSILNPAETLQTVEIPDDVKTIGKYAFFHCDGVESVIIPAGVRMIWSGAFHRCRNLRKIHIPNTVREIGCYAFLGCDDLTQVRIPDSVEVLEYPVFSKKVHLEDYPDGLVILNHVLIQYLGTDKIIRIPETVKRIGWNAFDEAPVETLIFPETPVLIESSSIHSCKNLKSLAVGQIQIPLENSSYDKMIQTFDLAHQILDLLHGKESEETRNHLLQNRELLFRVDYETFRKILQTGKIFMKNIIDEAIAYAFAIQDHEKQILLLDYKYQHFDFKQIGENLKL
ncbi:MAG: leucine-rich repeat domain-containing protein [Oscillospiraceae bacterium]|nr:leucine-rich repeat domain-containing protein [Oscillospiraceae bacterium]